jgi:transcriptional regulator with XRE-family HTH domain
MKAETFGEFFKRKRLEKGLGLRQFSVAHGYGAGNISRLERGVLSPPKDHRKLRQYAKHLGLVEGSDDWTTFFDLAYAGAGRVPPSIMSDNEKVAQLPMVFRTLRGERLTKKEIDSLLEKLRRA